MKPYVAKKAISFVLLFGLSGVGVSAAHAQPGKLEIRDSTIYTVNKDNHPGRRVFCYWDNNLPNGRYDAPAYNSLNQLIHAGEEYMYLSSYRCDQGGGTFDTICYQDDNPPNGRYDAPTVSTAGEASIVTTNVSCRAIGTIDY